MADTESRHSSVVHDFVAEAKELIARVERDLEDLTDDVEGHLRVAVVHLRHLVGHADPTHREPAKRSKKAASTPDGGNDDATGETQGEDGQGGEAPQQEGGDPAEAAPVKRPARRGGRSRRTTG